jgi:hypothetical protein
MESEALRRESKSMTGLHSFIFYALLGIGVATANYLGHDGPIGWRISSSLLSFAFWPLYLPIILRTNAERRVARETRAGRAADGAFASAIEQVEGELALALASLEGWAGGVLAGEGRRIEELKRAWRAQSCRISEMDEILRNEALAANDLTEPALIGSERAKFSEEARRKNLERLQRARGRACEDLAGTLASVRELVSRIHLARFTGAPASRAQQLVAQVAASVEGLSAAVEAEAEADGDEVPTAQFRLVHPSGPAYPGPRDG